MKKFYTLFLAVIIVEFTNAQNPIPNPGFETWWGLTGQPNGWTDSRDINQGSPGHSGFQAAIGAKSSTAYPAFITSSAGVGLSISSAYTNFNLYYKFTSVASDDLFISVSVRNAAHAQIGSGIQQITASANNFTFLSIPINYSGSNPQEVIISVIMNSNSGGVATSGSSFMLDDLSLDFSPLAMQEIEKESSALQVFPNPANNFIQIRFNEPKGTAGNIQITDMLGRMVKEHSLSSNQETMDISDLPSGNYIVAVKNDEIIQTKRMVVR